jgi:Ca2+-binding EF-hand superfamily protein
LDGNNFVTPDEMTLLLTASDRKDVAGEVARNMQYDTNNDKKIDFNEMKALSAKRKNNYQLRELAMLLELDPNKDGELTIKELRAMVSEAFSKYDADGDGFLSLQEKSAVSNVLKDRQKKSS